MGTVSFNSHSLQFIELVLTGEMDEAGKLLKSEPSILMDRNVSGETPLHWLAIENEPDGVKLLLDNGADLNTQDNSGDVVLHDAASLGHTEVVAVLLAHGVKLEATHSLNRETALHAAARDSPDPRVIDQLVDAGANVHALDHLDGTPLHAAALSGNIKTAERLLHRGADPTRINGFDQTALEWVKDADRPAWEMVIAEAIGRMKSRSSVKGGDKVDD